MKYSLFAAGLALATALPAAAQDHADWVADFDVAAAQARAEGKDLLVDFTGSDWCGWCIRLDEEVFSHAEFLEPAKERFVLVYLDYPNGEEAKAKVPNPERNEELSAKYAIEGFPTILLMTPDGDVFGRTGYQEGGPVKFVEHLTELVTNGKAELKQVLELVAAYKEASEKMPILEKAVTMLAGMNESAAGKRHLVKLARKALAEAKDDELRRRALDALIDSGSADKETFLVALKIDPENATGLPEKVLTGLFENVSSEETARAALEALAAFDGKAKFQDEDARKQFYLMATLWNFRALDDAEAAIVYAKKLKELGGLDERMAEFVEEVLSSGTP